MDTQITLDTLARGSCVGSSTPERWWPTPRYTTEAMARYAARVCAGCPVSVECLAYALENDFKEGVWGGVSEKDRAVMQRTRPDVPLPRAS